MKSEKMINAWKNQTITKKIMLVLAALLLIGLSTRSWILTLIAWGIIFYLAIKIIMDLELF